MAYIVYVFQRMERIQIEDENENVGKPRVALRENSEESGKHDRSMATKETKAAVKPRGVLKVLLIKHSNVATVWLYYS